MRALTLAVAAVGLAISPRTLAMDDNFKLIVNPNNPITAVDRDFLRDAYLKKVIEWPGNIPIQPVELSSKFPAHERFTREVLRKSNAQLKNYWNQQIFSGKGVPPQEAGSVSAAVDFVIENPGAIAYVPIDADVRHAKVIGIK
jgi:ABC-type phosphate transport system substrate-binding protein